MASAIASGRSKTRSHHFTKGLYSAAIEELKRDLDVVTTNAPINDKEGDKDQSELERENARSFKAAISLLQKQ
jgi:hypothetical protein